MANSYFKHVERNKRETMIVFVYDTERCKDEADDPVEAVLYFHPSWVSDIQKLSLCGQLMGTTYFLKENFFKPKIISLQNGKFILREFGRFILAVGTDRNLPNSLLERRADLLTSLVKFFHRDIELVYDQFSASGQYKNLSEKLYHIFETYLPILQYNGNIFQNVPTLRLPKSASNIFLDAMQTLESCQQVKGILGGTILYHNKVVATQLSAEITKNLVLTDPYRIKSTSEPVHVNYHVPIGVQIIVVYIPNNEYRKLLVDSQRAQSIITQNLCNQTPLPFQFQKRKMKRDKSLIFSNIPEEGTCDTSTTAVISSSNKQPTETSSNPSHGEVNQPRHKTAVNRPNHLPLRFKNATSREIPESGFASINFDESDSYPEFIGHTSVCSTPMTENKILHGTIMSICANPNENLILSKDKTKTNSNSVKSNNKTENNDAAENSNGFKIDIDRLFSNFVSNPYKLERRNSFTDLHDSLKKISKKLTFRQFGLGLSKLDLRNGNFSNGDETPDYVDDIEKETKGLRTITDPTYPVFKSDGEPISKGLFQEFIEKHHKSWNEKEKEDEKIEKLIEEFKEFDNELKNANLSFKEIQGSNADKEFINKILKESNLNENIETNNVKPKTPINRSSLTLPLKSLNDNATSGKEVVHSSTSIFEKKNKLPGIQLTPLMAKLSVLALNEEKSSGFCSWDTTPGMELATPIDSNRTFRRKSSIRTEDIFDLSSDNYQKVELYICGQQNMTLLLLLEEGSAQKQNLIQAMFDTCVSRLTKIETNLNQTLNVNVDGDKSEGGYSFICIDPKWDALQRGGPWSPIDLNSLECMHKDLNMAFPITDLTLRMDDSVLYGYKCGRTEVFYKQPSQSQPGLPPPADVMGMVAMKAQRRLEREQSFVLF